MFAKWWWQKNHSLERGRSTYSGCQGSCGLTINIKPPCAGLVAAAVEFLGSWLTVNTLWWLDTALTEEWCLKQHFCHSHKTILHCWEALRHSHLNNSLGRSELRTRDMLVHPDQDMWPWSAFMKSLCVCPFSVVHSSCTLPLCQHPQSFCQGCWRAHLLLFFFFFFNLLSIYLSVISFWICLYCMSSQPPVAMNSGSSYLLCKKRIYFYLSYTDLLAVAMNIAGYGK